MQRLLISLVLIGVVSSQSYIDDSSVDTATTNCACGWGDRARIVGGKEAKANAYPFMAALTFSRSAPFCGASIITARHALTAAHCTYEHRNNSRVMFLLVGAHRVPGGQLMRVRRTIEHDKYDSVDNEKHDIAIVELEKDLVFRSDVGPVCLPFRRVNLENYNVLVAGWGLTQHEGEASEVLREVILKVIPWSTCSKFYPDDLHVPRTQFCTYEKKKDSCQGDSGGPLVGFDDKINRLVLVGVVSYGRDCASESPAVNTEVGAYLDWIKRVVKETSQGSLETCSRIS